jgi:PAS domain S-box-containing protein
MLGYKNKKELLETHPSELSPEIQSDGRNSFEKVNEILPTVFDQGSIRLEWDHKRKNGEVFPVEVLLTAVPLGERKFIHAVWRDITERKHTEDELDQYQMQLRALASEITIAEEQERRRIAIELHDYIIQDLGLSKIKLGELVQRLSADDCLHLAEETRELIEGIIKESRSLVFDLSLPVLYDLGYVAAIKWLAEQTEKKLNIPCEVRDDGQSKPMNKEMQVLLFKAVRELMNNISKHAHANEVNILINRVNGQINTSVQDDGVGFDPAHIELYRGESLKFGLFGIKERLNLLNGLVKISSTPGSGTNITLTVPLEIDD